MSDKLDHIRWTRVSIEPQIKPKQGGGGPRPPLRRDPKAHGHIISGQAKQAIEQARQQRPSGPTTGVPLVLRFQTIGPDPSDVLSRLGIHVLEEHVQQSALENPHYEVTIRFRHPNALNGFEQVVDTQGFQITRINKLRDSNGGEDTRRLVICFADKATADAFIAAKDDRTKCSVSFEVEGKPKRVSKSESKIVTVESDDAMHLFLRELDAHRNNDGEGTLTAKQRSALFDSLETVSRPGRDDRMGERLRTEGTPSTPEILLDVDLWHPGLRNFREATQQFQAIVTGAGGTVLGKVTPLNILLIARVRGTTQTLEALLEYDRVSRVDLPPPPSEVKFTIFDGNPEMAADIIPPDGPLACLVDSGVLRGHPLLNGVVVAERDFDSGEGTVVDRIGHGTHLAGFIVYGVPHDCLQSGAPWVPRVRLVSAKVLRRIAGGYAGEKQYAGFADDKRAEEQLRTAIEQCHEQYGCRVFNVSVGNSSVRLGRGHQLPWALLFDELARRLDIVVVVSAGNTTSDPPLGLTETDFQAAVRERLFSEDHALIDPASAANVLTVGAISRQCVPYGKGDERVGVVGSPIDCPAPFTRTGLVDSSGSGPCRAIKPELVAYGGNLVIKPPEGRWHDEDRLLGEPSLRLDITGGRLLDVACGTSVAAPYVTHICALVAHRLEELLKRPPTANLVRAMVVHSAEVPDAASEWVSREQSKPHGRRRQWRSLGYGKPDADRAMYSDHNRAILFAEDTLREKRFHLYRFELPDEFLSHAGVRCVRVTLAYDPPVNGARRDYLSRVMTLQMIRGVSQDAILSAASKGDGDTESLKLPERAKRIKPAIPAWSTVQSASCSGKTASTFECRKDGDSGRCWHILVGCKRKFETDASNQPRRYALVASLEHSAENARLHEQLRLQVQPPVTQRVSLSLEV